MTHYHTVVIGGGQAGLGVSYYLTQKGINHTVLERGKIGESWRRQRWDSFTLNTPNSINILPGYEDSVKNPDEFWSRNEFIDVMEQYAQKFSLPVQDGVTVNRVNRDSNSGQYHLETSSGTMTADNVVIASGSQNTAKIPAIADAIPTSLMQIHAEQYRSADALPQGATLVIGSGQSGVQIAEDLIDAGRKVYLATSKVGRIRRRLMGRDLISWAVDAGFFDQTQDDLEHPAMAYNAQPQISGTNGGHTVSLPSLEKKGAKLLGRFAGFDNGQFRFEDNLADNIVFADMVSAKFKGMVEGFVKKQGIDAPPPEQDEADEPDTGAGSRHSPTAIDPVETGIASVIWCTGFTGDFSWIENIELDKAGIPVHEKGVAKQPGLYFCGFPWLSKRKSGLIYGIQEDAAYITDRLSG